MKQVSFYATVDAMDLMPGDVIESHDDSRHTVDTVQISDDGKMQIWIDTGARRYLAELDPGEEVSLAY